MNFFYNHHLFVFAIGGVLLLFTKGNFRYFSPVNGHEGKFIFLRVLVIKSLYSKYQLKIDKDSRNV